MKGFITIEGIEGAGKTTAIEHIKTALKEMGVNKEVVTTREPGGIEIAEEIRSIILNPKNTAMDAVTEAMLYAAARRQHLTEKVIPALNNGHVVICDRFIDSSLAYQGYARGLGIDEVYAINKIAIDDYMPGLTIYLDIRPEIGLARIHADKNREINRLDMEKLDFHNRVYDGYEQLIKRFPERIKVINADQSIEHVLEDIKKVLKLYFS